MTADFRTRLSQPRVIACAALRAARTARRLARFLRLHRLHRARRDGDCRRRLGRGEPQRRFDARGPHVAGRRRCVLADPARSQAGGTRLPARARPGFGRGGAARHGPQRRRQAGAGRTQGRGRQLPDARRGDARSQNADGGSAGRAQTGAFGAAVDSTLLARLDLKLGDRITHRQRRVPDPQRGRRRAGQARRQCRAGPARSGQRGEPARHRIAAARQPGALDLPA